MQVLRSYIGSFLKRGKLEMPSESQFEDSPSSLLPSDSVSPNDPISTTNSVQNKFVHLISQGWSTVVKGGFAQTIFEFLTMREGQRLGMVNRELKGIIENSKMFNVHYTKMKGSSVDNIFLRSIRMNIVSLDLSNSGMITDERMEIIGRRITGIRRLNLSGMQGTENLSQASSEILTLMCRNSLEELNLSGWKAGFLSYGKFLHSVDFSSNSITTPASPHSIPTLSSCFPLRVLILQDCSISSYTLSSIDFRHVLLLEEFDFRVSSLFHAINSNLSFLHSLKNLRRFHFRIETNADITVFFILASLPNLRFLSISLSSSFIEKYLDGRSQSAILLKNSFPSLENVELIVSYDFIASAAESKSNSSNNNTTFKSSNNSESILKFIQIFNDLPTVKSIRLRIDRGKVRDEVRENSDAQIHINCLLKGIIKNQKLKVLSYPKYEEWQTRLCSLEIISNLNSIEVLELPRLIGKRKLTLLKGMKSLRALRIQLNDSEKNFQFDWNDCCWFAEDSEFIEEYLNAKEKSVVHHEKVKKAIQKFVNFHLPNVFFALHFE